MIIPLPFFFWIYRHRCLCTTDYLPSPVILVLLSS
jgi:hypothetical protein